MSLRLRFEIIMPNLAYNIWYLPNNGVGIASVGITSVGIASVNRVIVWPII